MKLTTPQKPTPRLKFFLEHPEFPNAANEIQTCRLKMKGTHRKPKQKPTVNTTPAPVQPIKPATQSFLQKLMSPRKTMSGGA